jgi:hypothetical protein
MESKFTEIYDKKKWGSKNGKGSSGSGSNCSPDTKWYISLLMRHIEETESKSICDMGCGDWEFSKTIDWSGLHYTGIDCVKSVIEDNRLNYEKDNIKFIHGEAGDIPEGYDFVIIKDVIQHWTDEQIEDILPQIISKNKYVFLGNGYKFGRDKSKNNWTDRTLDKIYKYHPIDISKRPLSTMGLNVKEVSHRRCKEFILLN